VAQSGATTRIIISFLSFFQHFTLHHYLTRLSDCEVSFRGPKSKRISNLRAELRVVDFIDLTRFEALSDVVMHVGALSICLQRISSEHARLRSSLRCGVPKQIHYVQVIFLHHLVLHELHLALKDLVFGQVLLALHKIEAFLIQKCTLLVYMANQLCIFIVSLFLEFSFNSFSIVSLRA
jgi:hypothetical protein